MARFRLSGPARADVAHILATSAERWGVETRRRYAAILAAAMRKVAADPKGPATHKHILYYRVIVPGLVEIVRVLHDRMEPSRHLTD
jgi:toxin ParE1/3/4